MGLGHATVKIPCCRRKLFGRRAGTEKFDRIKAKVPGTCLGVPSDGQRDHESSRISGKAMYFNRGETVTLS